MTLAWLGAAGDEADMEQESIDMFPPAASVAVPRRLLKGRLLQVRGVG